MTDRPTSSKALEGDAYDVVGLFAGIGGIERGFASAGHRTTLLCELDNGAGAVLKEKFPEVAAHEKDVADLKALPEGTQVVCAGFPCQDLSQAGRTEGISGRNSGLVGHVFRLLDKAKDRPPKWVVLENVPFMLRLDQGKALHYLTDALEHRGYSWAYRIVNTLAFGLPQRRRRVLLVASSTEDPRGLLLGQDAGPPAETSPEGKACGFYWTEGLRGLGWAVDAIPTLKGGSSIGIPSPPAILLPDGRIITPSLRDAERVQGFDADWTYAGEVAELAAGASERRARSARWKLVGNAVSVPVAEWLGERLRESHEYTSPLDTPLADEASWPDAAWHHDGVTYRAEVSEWPVLRPAPALVDFLQDEGHPLSVRATAGFYERTQRAKLRFPDGFEAKVFAHLERMRKTVAIPAVV